MFTPSENSNFAFVAPIKSKVQGPCSFRLHIETRTISDVAPLDGDPFASKTTHEAQPDKLATKAKGDSPNLYEPVPDIHFIDACGVIEGDELFIEVGTFATQIYMMSL